MSLLPSWNLSDLFSGITDPKIEQSLDVARKSAKEFGSMYRGTLGKTSIPSAEYLCDVLNQYESILQSLGKVSSYAHLVFASDTSDPKHGAFMQRINTEYQQISQELIFVDLELLSLGEDVFQSFFNDPILSSWHYYLSRLKDQKPHRLSEEVEKILGEKSLTSSQAFSRLFDQEFSRKRFRMEGEERDFYEDEILHLLHDGNRDVRRRAAEGFTKGLEEEMPRLSFIFNLIGQDKHIEDRNRHFSSPESARHLDNDIRPEAVEALNQAVGNAYPMVQDFYRFKREVLGLETLYEYDRYAPIEDKTPLFSFDEARDIVLTSFERFDPKFAEMAKLFFDNGWIDADKRTGKQGGAFCASVTPDHHPYVFINFNSSARDVMVLAHELGHGIHAVLAKKQHYLDFHAPLPVCETASIFGELLVFETLKQQFADNKPALFSLYMKKIEDIFASAFRQMSMYRFERDLHAGIRSNGELLPKEINALWRHRQEEMFGESVTFTSNYDKWWSYIPHFIHTPFYVYAYSFGELLTLSVFAQYKKEGSSAISRYTHLLEYGGSKSPHTIIQDFGLNIHDPNFWNQGLAIIEEMIAEAKEIYRSLPLTEGE